MTRMPATGGGQATVFEIDVEIVISNTEDVSINFGTGDSGISVTRWSTIDAIFEHNFDDYTGEILILVNWTIFVFACAEALSITENLEKLGFSIPVLNVILKYGRRKSFKVIAEAFDSPEMVDELERAAGGKVKIVRVHEDDANKGTDDENHDH